MILRLVVDLFQNPSQTESKLLRSLLQTLLDHDGDAQPPILRLAPEVEETDPRGIVRGWLDRQGELGAEVQELLQISGISEVMLPVVPLGLEVSDRSHGPGAWRRAPSLDVTVVPGSHSDWPSLRLAIIDALELTKEPLHLRLEDANNDFAFVSWLASPDSRRALEQLYREPARIVVQGGGATKIKRWLDALIRYPVLPPEQQRRLWRTWVLFDKDAGALDARTPSKSALELIERCEQVVHKHRIPFSWVCLQRREIESYIPDDGLRRTGAVGSDEAAALLRRWRAHPDHQGHAWAYDMKKGLKGDLVPGLSATRRDQIMRHHAVPHGNEVKLPFSTLEKETRRILLGGFGDGVLNQPLHREPRPGWLHQIANEYDRGPSHQFSRLALVQSIFDRI